MTQHPGGRSETLSEADVREVVADALGGIAYALYVAAGVILLGMFPMSLAGAVLQTQAQQISRRGQAQRRP